MRLALSCTHDLEDLFINKVLIRRGCINSNSITFVCVFANITSVVYYIVYCVYIHFRIVKNARSRPIACHL